MYDPVLRYFITMGVLFGTILIIFAMKYISAAYQARLRARSDDAYRQLVEKTASVQTQSATSLSAMQTDLSEINARLAAVEKILKAVE
jgi:HAMP domain-containing protein